MASQEQKLKDALTNLYFAGRWTCDRPVPEADLWEAAREALELPPGARPPAAEITPEARGFLILLFAAIRFLFITPATWLRGGWR